MIRQAPQSTRTDKPFPYTTCIRSATHASIGRTRKSSMGAINIPHDQQGAIAAIDARELDRLIEQAIREERSSDLHRLALANCGSYIATKLHSFEDRKSTRLNSSH